MNYIVTFVCLCFVFGVWGEHKHSSLVSANRVDDKPRSMELEQLQQHVNSSRFSVAPASLQLEKRQSMGMPLKLVAGDLEASAFFGRSAALSSDGNTALIGAYGKHEGGFSDAGASYIFTRTGTEWSQQMKLVANDLELTARFGISAALSSDGNTALIGAYYKDEGGFSHAGASYIFTRTGAEWSQQMKLVANDLEAYALFGYSVALSSDGNTALIGAYEKNEGGLSGAGASYIFTRTGTEWSQQMKLVANDLEAYAWFGYSVALSSDGNTALIGANEKHEGGLTRAGASYIFTRTGTEWSQQMKLVANDLQANAYFGMSAALSSDGNTALIGAYAKDEGGLSEAGASYIFTRTGTEWSQQMKLVANDLEASALFGRSAALSSDGNTALIGAYAKDEGGFGDAGASYIFTRTGTEWSQQMKLVAKDLEASAYFGMSAALSSDGNTALIGAHYKNEGGLSEAGASYIFTRTGTEWSQQMKLVANYLEAGASFGRSAALSSDGNTALIGAYLKDEGALSKAGASYIFTRTGTEWSQQMKLVANDLEASALLGYRAALSSDGNTALIGAIWKDEGGLKNAGASYIFTGLLSPLPTTAPTPFPPDETPTTAPTPFPPGETLAPTDSTPAPTPSVSNTPTHGQSPVANTAPVPALTGTATPTDNSFPTVIPVVEGDFAPIIVAILCIIVICLLILAFFGFRHLKRKQARLSSPVATHLAAVIAVDGSSNPRSRSASRSALRRQPSSHADPPARSRSSSSTSRRQSRSLARNSYGSRKRTGSAGNRSQSGSISKVLPSPGANYVNVPSTADYQRAPLVGYSPAPHFSSPYTPAPAFSSHDLTSHGNHDPPGYGRPPGLVGVNRTPSDQNPPGYGRSPGLVGVLNRSPGDQKKPNLYSKILPLSPEFASRHLIPLDDVQKLQLLGSGAFGEVHLGAWKGVDVAIKQIKGVDEGARRQLVQEAHRFTLLRNHPNVVSFYGLIADPLSIVMEYCPGGALGEALYGKKSKHFTEQELLLIARGIALGVAHLHAANIVHRDLAARNVLLGIGNVPKVTDFGMSRTQTQYDQRTQTAMGPIKWMSPEQLFDSVVSKSSDIWSFGVVLYEMFQKQKPWSDRSNVEAARHVMQCGSLPTPENAPSKIVEAMQGCFQFDPSKRLLASELAAMLSAQDGKAKRRSRHSVQLRNDNAYDQPPQQIAGKQWPKASESSSSPGYLQPPSFH